MVRIKGLLSNRFAKPAAIITAALAILLGSTGSANAAIYWSGIQMVNQASQQCLAAQGNGVDYARFGFTVPGCMANGTGWILLYSTQPDANGDANVQIETYSPSGELLCLEPYVQADIPRPNGPNSTLTSWTDCNYIANMSGMTWEMQTVAPSQDVGNPAGPKHFISFYNAGSNVCLDGGIGVYGFAGHCSNTNNWQIWNIYTDQTSSPYQG